MAQPIRSSAASTWRAFADLKRSGSGRNDEVHARRLLRRDLSVFKALGHDVKRQRFDLGERLLARRAVHVAAGNGLNQADPPPVLFSVEFHGQCHSRRIAEA